MIGQFPPHHADVRRNSDQHSSVENYLALRFILLMSTISNRTFLTGIENQIVGLFSEDHADARPVQISESAFIRFQWRSGFGKVLGPQIKFILFWHDST